MLVAGCVLAVTCAGIAGVVGHYKRLACVRAVLCMKNGSAAPPEVLQHPLQSRWLWAWLTSAWAQGCRGVPCPALAHAP